MDIQPSVIKVADVSVDVLLEFFEVAIHSILYVRNIYPAGIFVKMKKYGIAVHMSVHPELNDYISNCLISLRPMLLKNDVESLVICFKTPEDNIQERFVFEIKRLAADTIICNEDLLEAEKNFRSFCLRIATCTADLKNLPKGCKFIIQIHSKLSAIEENQMDLEQSFPWIGSDYPRSSLIDPTILPLKSSDNTLFKMQMFAESVS